MASVSLIGIDDGALRAAVAELIDEVGGLLEPEPALGQPDLAMVTVVSTDDLDERLEAIRFRHPYAKVLVLMPFSQPALVARALARGAAACHALDQPTVHLRATLRTLLGTKRSSSVSGELA